MGHTEAVPYGPGKGGEHWAWRNVCRLLLCPVIRGKSSSDGALTKCNDEIHQPEEDQQITKLKDEDITVVQALAPVKGEKTLSARTLLGDVSSIEVLVTINKHK